MPPISARVRVQFGPADSEGYRLAGTPEQMAGEIGAFADQSVSALALDFRETDPERCTSLIERFDREVVPAYREAALTRSTRA